MKYCDIYFEDLKKVSQAVPNLDKLKNTTVCIYGASGLIGSSIADILFYLNSKEDYDIKLILAGRDRKRIAERFSIYSEGGDYTYAPYDGLRNDNDEIEADYYIHCASSSSPSSFAKEPVETLMMNASGVYSALKAAVKHNGRFLFVSSSEVYGINEKNEPFKEEDLGYLDILNERACYPSGKRAAESLCIAFSKEYGADTVIVRPGHVYGPQILESDNHASSEFLRNAKKGEDIVLKSRGTQLRSYCYSLDCASGILTALLDGREGSAYNISNKEAVVTISDLALEYAELSGRSLKFVEATKDESRSYNLMPTSALCAEKLEKLGWKALFDIKKGTEHTFKCY